MQGQVFIVGAGPGDPELVTLRAKKVIKKADVILYDRLIHKGILQWARPICKVIFVGKKKKNHREQSAINKLLAQFAKKGKKVVRLKGGDPFIFGRGGEEVLYLREHQIPYEIVPGVSSVTGIPALAGIPLTHRGLSSSFAVITGHGANNQGYSVNWKAVAQIETLVILMGVSPMKQIAKKLLQAGRDKNEPVAIIEKGSTKREKITVTSLALLYSKPPKIDPPAIIVIGKTVTLSQKILQKGAKDES